GLRPRSRAQSRARVRAQVRLPARHRRGVRRSARLTMRDPNRIVSRARSLAQCHSVADLQRLARRRLPAPMYHYLEGGADDEWTLRRNVTAFDDYELWPHYLTDISSI